MKLCFKHIKDKLINLLFPKDIKCIVCDEELNSNKLYSLCDKCLQNLPFNSGKTCLRCDEPIVSQANYCLNCKNHKPHYKQNKSVFIYDGIIKTFVRGLKFDNKKYYANTMANFIASEYVKLKVEFDIVIPVPLHKIRLKDRGYNQANLLCNALKEKLKVNVDDKVLEKHTYTKAQAYLNKAERQKNLENSFKVIDKTKIKGKTVLLIDDVFTTGSTINECAKVLKSAGAKEVYSLTFAHAHNEVKDNN